MVKFLVLLALCSPALAQNVIRCDTPGKAPEFRDRPCAEGKQTTTDIPLTGYPEGVPFPAGYIDFTPEPGHSFILKERHEIHAEPADRGSYYPSHRPYGYVPSVGRRWNPGSAYGRAAPATRGERPRH